MNKLKNKKGQLAKDLTTDSKIKELLAKV